MRKITLLAALMIYFLTSCTKKTEQPTDYVDPFIGTGGHGHTYPGASLPFGMMQLSPDTRLTGWDGCSGYHFTDSVIYGFSHTHLSGTGCSDYGDILLMPTVGNIYFNNGADGQKGYYSAFRKENEYTAPGFYQVHLDDYVIDVELTATKRAGMHRYTFHDADTGNVILDLVHRDRVLHSDINIISETKIEGVRKSAAWASKQQIFFAIEFSKPFCKHFEKNENIYKPGTDSVSGKKTKAAFQFTFKDNKNLLVKVGISAVSTEGAWKNLNAEIPDWDFEKIKNDATEAWNNELSKIVVEGGAEAQKTIFYTALYHALLNPNLFMDVDGQYLGRDLKAHQANGFDYYTTFSLWDTYRAEHPLLTIIDQKRTNDFIKTFLMQYQQGGSLPVWEFAANETMCMIGYHAVPVIVDAFMKGIGDFDPEEAFEAMKHSATRNHLGLDAYMQSGYVPADKEHESVSKTLEYAYDDWCIAQMAKALGKEEDYKTFIKRAQSYKNIYDKESGFMRAKLNGSWFSPFDPKEVNNHYTEANSWQYSFYVPQDISGLINLNGGKENFLKKLDQLFQETSETSGREQADITGLIGQYAHGNEPSHHMAYLYAYANAPWKTQEMAARIMKEMYSTQTDGYSGNEDCGQMSAWYVLSAMGFYPVTPGSNQYVIGSPVFDRVTIHLENGKQFIIQAKDVSAENIYIQSATLNHKTYNKSYLKHEDIMKGGKLVFKMGPHPNENWGSKNEEIPVSSIGTTNFVTAPTLVNKSKTFYGELMLEFEKTEGDTRIYYSLELPSSGQSLSPDSIDILQSMANNENKSFLLYDKPISIQNSTTIVAYAEKNGVRSAPMTAHFVKSPSGRKVNFISDYAPQYSAGGDQAIIDGIRGDYNWRLGGWQGYGGNDFEAIIDLDQAAQIKRVSLNFLQDNRSWILMPTEVEVYISAFDHKFEKVAVIKNDVPQDEEKVTIKNFTATFKPQKTVAIKIIAKNIKTLPEWHIGAGNKAWIFVDEISIE